MASVDVTRCSQCKKPLHVEESIRKGIGPKCRAKLRKQAKEIAKNKEKWAGSCAVF